MSLAFANPWGVHGPQGATFRSLTTPHPGSPLSLTCVSASIMPFLLLPLPQQSPTPLPSALPACSLSSAVGNFSAFAPDPESSACPSPWLSLDPSNTVTGLILHSFVLEVSPPHFCSASGALQQHPRVLGRGIDAFSPRHLPAAPRLSPHHPFPHHHWTEVYTYPCTFTGREHKIGRAHV